MTNTSPNRVGWMTGAVAFAALVGGALINGFAENAIDRLWPDPIEMSAAPNPHELNRLWLKEALERMRIDHNADILAVYGYPPDQRTRARLLVVQRPGLDITWRVGEWTSTNVPGRKDMLEMHRRRICESVFLHSLPVQSEFREIFIRRNLDSAISYPIFDRGDLVGYLSWQTLRPSADKLGRPEGDWHAAICRRLEGMVPLLGSSVHQYVTAELSSGDGDE